MDQVSLCDSFRWDPVAVHSIATFSLGLPVAEVFPAFQAHLEIGPPRVPISSEFAPSLPKATRGSIDPT